MKSTVFTGCYVPVRMKEEIDKLVPGKYVTVSEFLAKAIKEKLEREGVCLN